MIEKLIHSSSAQEFIALHENDDVQQLVLRQRDVDGIPMARIAEQIVGRRKAKDKLPEFYSAPGIIYPPGLNLEQSSSSATAQYKIKILKEELQQHQVCVDLTGGFGVDSYFFSRIFSEVNYVEVNHDLLEIVRHNHTVLQAVHILHNSSTAESFLEKEKDKHADLVYIDPSRRAQGKKVFKLSDCEPDVTGLQQSIFNTSKTLLVKTSPLLDIQQGVLELSGVKKVYIVSVDNECKELLFLCEKDFIGEAMYYAVNIRRNEIDTFVFNVSQEKETVVEYEFIAPTAGVYLYEPNASILKAGAFKQVAARYGVTKIHPNTHLYVAQQRIQDFPGRTFRVEALVKPDKKELRTYFADGKANVTTRNYSMSVEELKKRTGLTDGGDKYLIGFSGMRQKFLVVAERV